MSHQPNKYDVICDLRRAIMASFSDKLFDDENVKIFLANAEKNLSFIKDQIGSTENFRLSQKLINRAKDSQKSAEERREDLLTASCLLI